MKRIAAFASILISVAVLPGCEETKRAFGQTKEAPDEFAVYRRAPLSLPPEYQLRPPVLGAQRPQVVNPRNRARRALGIPVEKTDRASRVKSKNVANLSNGERALLNLIGAKKANPQIRQLVEKESMKIFEDSKGFTDNIVFWKNKGKFGTAVDPENEQKRIREAQALGKPLNSKDIPEISRKKKAIFEGIFN